MQSFVSWLIAHVPEGHPTEGIALTEEERSSIRSSIEKVLQSRITESDFGFDWREFDFSKEDKDGLLISAAEILRKQGVTSEYRLGLAKKYASQVMREQKMLVNISPLLKTFNLF